MYDFISDLDEYFCEKYANYDKLCVLPGYKMPTMQATEIREDGQSYAYTLPADTMRLARQEKKDELLAELKKRMIDKTFSFSFRPLNTFARLKNLFSKYGFYKNFNKVLEKYKLTDEEVLSKLDITEEIWKGIRKNKFLPSKNLIFTFALSNHLGYDDTAALLALCEYQFDYAMEKDVVVSYLLKEKIFNEDMLQAAFEEYKIDNLFFKKA